MEKKVEELLGYLDSKQTEMVALLQQLVEHESPFADTERVAAVGEFYAEQCRAAGCEVVCHPMPGAGPVLVAKLEQGAAKTIGFMGHLDTVHAVGSFGEQLFTQEGDVLRGPGVYDCKGGWVIALYLVKAFKELGYTDYNFKIMLPGDEECAHALSHGAAGELLKVEAQECTAIFNCESGLLDGSPITTRKGGGLLQLTLKGKAAHAGRNPQDGASAIRAAAHMICAIEELSDFNATSFNCGKITGGAGGNIIPEACSVVIGIRYMTNEGYEQGMQALERIVATEYVPGVSAKLEIIGMYPAMEKTAKTDALFELYSKANEELGYPPIKQSFAGGCSDAAFVAQVGVPVLCSVGIVGEGAHTREEWASAASLPKQAKKIAKTILAMPENF